MINIFDLLGITTAHAEVIAPAASPQSGGLLSLLPMLAILILFMYFMVVRPQSKRSKEHKNLISNIKAGDEVVTIGGILGRVEEISDDFFVLNIAEGTNITVQKNAIASCLPKGTIKTA